MKAELVAKSISYPNFPSRAKKLQKKSNDYCKVIKSKKKGRIKVWSPMLTPIVKFGPNLSF